MKKILTFAIVLILAFSLFACGEKTPSSESSGSGGSSLTSSGTSGTVGGTLDSGYKYSYNPPTDNYYIVWQDFNSDGSVRHDPEIFACTQNGYSYATVDGVWHASIEQQKYYCRANDDGDWMIDPGYSYEDWKDDFEDGTDCNMFDEYFMYYFRAYGYDDDEGRLSDYYVGTEKLDGIDCMVFDSKGLNAIYGKFWVDPANGCCIKYLDTESGEYSVATTYNLSYTAWTDNLAPSSYEGID